MSTVSTQFRYSCGRLLDDQLQRVIRNGAMLYGVQVSHSQIRGWISHDNYWTVTGDPSKVAAFVKEATRVFSELASDD